MAKAEIKPIWWLIACLMLAGLPFLVYSNALDSAFVADDLPYIERNPDVVNLTFPEIFLNLRPLTKISFWLNQQFHGQDMAGYHLTNISLHALAGVLLFFLLIRLLQREGPISPTSLFLALAGALVFELHPVHTQAVNYTFARSEILCAIFIFAALFVHAKPDARSYTHGRGAAVALLFLGALASKERAFMLIPALVLFDLWARRQENRPERFRRWQRLIIPLAVVGMLGLINFFSGFERQHAGGFALGQEVPEFTPYFLTQMIVRLHYLKLFFWPADLSFNYYFAPVDSLADPLLLAAVGFHLLLFGLAFRLYRYDGRLTFAICWFFLLILPTSGVSPGAVLMHEHWIYSPFLGFLLVLLVPARRFLASRRAPAPAGKGLGTLVLLGLLVLLGTLSHRRNRDWQSPVSLWLHASRYAAEIPWVWNNIAMAYLDRKDYGQAKKYLAEATKRGALPGAVHHNLGRCYLAEANYSEALKEFSQAFHYCPQQPEVLLSLAETHSALKNHEEAVEFYRGAARLGMPSPGLFIELAEVLLMKGDREKARQILAEGAKAYPGIATIQKKLGAIEEEQP